MKKNIYKITYKEWNGYSDNLNYIIREKTVLSYSEKQAAEILRDKADEAIEIQSIEDRGVVDYD